MELASHTGISQPDFESDIVSPQELAKQLHLPDTILRLLTRALTHRSFVNEHANSPEDNERLEFLGDAVLDFLVGAMLYKNFPEMAEGQLTRMRSALVCTDQLATFARQLNLGPAMRLGRGELSGGGRNRDNLLCDTFEALVGALYLHGGLKSVCEVTLHLFEEAADGLALQPDIYDAKSRLQVWAQSRALGIPDYETRLAEGPDHAKMFTVDVYINRVLAGTGTGANKRLAEQLAAADALKTYADSYDDEGLSSLTKSQNKR